MLLSKDFKKHRGLAGFWYSAKQRKAKVRICRPGAHGRRPWKTTFANVTIEEAREKYWHFRKACIEIGCKPGTTVRPASFTSMPTLNQYFERYALPGVRFFSLPSRAQIPLRLRTPGLDLWNGARWPRQTSAAGRRSSPRNCPRSTGRSKPPVLRRWLCPGRRQIVRGRRETGRSAEERPFSIQLDVE